MQEYRKSPYLHDVQLAAIDARIKGYMGPEYDASGLEKARKIIRKTMDDFHEQQVSEGLYHTLDVINEAEAEKTYLQGAYYKKIRRWPPPSITSESSLGVGRIAPGPSRQRPSSPSSQRCRGRRPNPAGS